MIQCVVVRHLTKLRLKEKALRRIILFFPHRGNKDQKNQSSSLLRQTNKKKREGFGGTLWQRLVISIECQS